ncbi:Heterokaryon incompatibility [Macrophomina phaseolina MS6]|uniref:Heterokaryon incompatibility n=1 Tax=Macrophomina phaseolina (strain MS6) TaxID=1126212 RepID=K2REN9_MACPH|nr:Heterokaryon incompatibility [Macrophomina phaseolina MS6]
MEGRGLSPTRNTGKVLSSRPGAEERYSAWSYTFSRYVVPPPVEFAQQTVSFMVALELLQAGAGVGTTTKTSLTPLHCAASSGWIDHINTLCSSGAPLQSGYGCSPACYAICPPHPLDDDDLPMIGNQLVPVKRRRLGENRQLGLEYLRKKLGPDAWGRVQTHSGCRSSPLPGFTWPSARFESWYIDELLPNASRNCLPGAVEAVSLEKSMNFCALCEGLSLQVLQSATGYIHANSLQALEISSHACDGCKFFISFLESRLSCTSSDDVTQVILRISREATSNGRGSVLRLLLSGGCYCNRQRSVEDRSLDFTQCLGKCDVMLMEDIGLDMCLGDYQASLINRLMYGRIPEPDSTSDASVATARVWLDRCQSIHTACNQRHNEEQSALPTRLVYVGELQNPESVHIVLGSQVSGDYAAFSHRWVSDGTTSWVTKKANVEDRMRQLDMSALPNGIQDAVKFCRRLGIPYIWIDSLCIIQDCEADWASESVKMLQVFGNAALTLFSDCAQNDAHHFLKARKAGVFQNRKGLTMPIQGSQGAAVEVLLLQRYSRYRSRLPAKAQELFRSDILKSTLSERGWIFQEQAISRRRLHFGSHQMYWMCGEEAQSEDGSDLSQVIPFWLGYGLTGAMNPASSPDHEQWGTMIENYTRRRLTKPADRLRALSGLAHLFGERYDDKYLGGLWTKQLKFNLLWAAQPPKCLPMFGSGTHSTCSLAYQSEPVVSWTWAATDCSITYPYLRARRTEVSPQYCVIKAPILTHTVDGFSSLPSAATPISILGRLEKAVTAGKPRGLGSDPQHAPPWCREQCELQGYCIPLFDARQRQIGAMIPDRPSHLPSEVVLLAAFESIGICPCCSTPKSAYRHFIVLHSIQVAEVTLPQAFWRRKYRRIGYGWTYNRDHKRLPKDAAGNNEVNELYLARWQQPPELIDIV